MSSEFGQLPECCGQLEIKNSREEHTKMCGKESILGVGVSEAQDIPTQRWSAGYHTYREHYNLGIGSRVVVFW